VSWQCLGPVLAFGASLILLRNPLPCVALSASVSHVFFLELRPWTFYTTCPTLRDPEFQLCSYPCLLSFRLCVFFLPEHVNSIPVLIIAVYLDGTERPLVIFSNQVNLTRFRFTVMVGEADIKSETLAPLRVVLLVILRSTSCDTCSASLGPSDRNRHVQLFQLLISSGAQLAFWSSPLPSSICSSSDALLYVQHWCTNQRWSLL
jgi:hypothetical protein